MITLRAKLFLILFASCAIIRGQSLVLFMGTGTVGGGAITLIDHKSGSSSGGGAGAPATTATMSCPAATMVSVTVYAANNDPATDVTITNSGTANTWSHFPTATSVFSIFFTTTFYVVGSPNVSSSMTFTATPVGGSLLGISATCFSGVSAADSADTGALSSGSTCQPGSITSTGATGLFLTMITSNNPGDTLTVDSSFATIETLLAVGGNSVGGSLAWVAASGTKNPTWTSTLALSDICQMVAFK